MFCVQEKEPHTDPFSNTDKDPLSAAQTDSSDDEPAAKRLKTFTTPSLNLKVYQIPAYNTSKSLSIYPTSTSTLPKFVNNPLNLANPLALAASLNGNNVKSLHSRYSLPSKLSITPVPSPAKGLKVNNTATSGDVVRYKKNGEIAKKRGPPKGYKRKPKKVDMSQSLTMESLLQAQNTILTNLLAHSNTTMTVAQPVPLAPKPPPIPRVKVPEGVEVVELELDPEDWFPDEPYKMTFSKKKHPKWKSFPYQCEHCFKGYRVASTLIAHCSDQHGAVPRSVSVPCPCCEHVSTRRKTHKQHLDTHRTRKRIYCPYCVHTADPTKEEHTKDLTDKESLKQCFEKNPQFWFAGEESLRLHKKRKHPYFGMFNYNWFSTWGENNPNS